MRGIHTDENGVYYKLLPCPFCGYDLMEMPYFTSIPLVRSEEYLIAKMEHKLIIGSDNGYNVKCLYCGALGARGMSREEAAARWNRRYSPKEHKKQLGSAWDFLSGLKYPKKRRTTIQDENQISFEELKMICKFCGSEMEETERGFGCGAEYSIYECADCGASCTVSERSDEEWEEENGND